MTIRFTKMHGIGNDYVYLDGIRDESIRRRDDWSRLAVAIGIAITQRRLSLNRSGWRGRRLMAVGMLTMLTLPGIQWGAHAETVDDRNNGAFWYQRSYGTVSKHLHADYGAVVDYLLRGDGPPPIDVRQVIDATAGAMQMVRRGASQTYADFGIPYSYLPGGALAHVGDMGRVSIMLAAQAKMALHDGNMRRYADNVEAMFNIASHLGADGFIASAVKGTNSALYADQLLQQGLDSGSLDAGTSRRLLRALEEVRSDDPFNVINATLTEYERSITWIVEQSGSAEGRETMLSIEDPLLSTFAYMPEAEFMHALDGYDRYVDEVSALMRMDDAEVARAGLEGLAQRRIDGEFGPLAEMVARDDLHAFSLIDAYESMVEAREMVAKHAESLQELTKGGETPESLAERNAALWYLRGIETMEVEGLERLVSIEEWLKAGAPRPIDPEVRGNLVWAGEAISLFLEGAARDRCDFSIAKEGRAPLVPRYGPGMRDAFTLVHADAIRHLDDNDMSGFEERMGASLRMSAHVADDGRIACSLVAHASFNRAVRLLRSHTNRIIEEHASATQLRHAVGAMSLTDPFGYAATADELKRHISGEWLRLRVVDEEGIQQIPKVKAFLADRDLTFLSFLGFALEAAGSKTEDQETQPLAWDMKRLDDLIGPMLPGAAEGLSDLVVEAMSEFDVEGLASWTSLPKFAFDRSSSARADLRAGLRVIGKLHERETTGGSNKDDDKSGT